MNETTTTQKTEFVFRRVADSFDQCGGDVLSAFVLNVFTLPLLVLVILAAVTRVAYKIANTHAHRPAATPAAPAAKDPVAGYLKLGFWLLVVGYALTGLAVYYFSDAMQTKRTSESLSTGGLPNDVKWYALTAAVFSLGSAFVIFMYVKDTRTVRWYFAAPLAMLRITVYAILCVVFLLPARQTWEETNKQSRVVILLDISPSVTDVADDTAGATSKKRIDLLIDFLTDEKVAFLKNLLEKNPVAVYAFGTRLDETPNLIGQTDPVWSRAEWDAFRRYDFKPFVLRGLSEEGKAEIKAARDWDEGSGTADWAGKWYPRRTADDLKSLANLSSDADVEILKKNLEKLDKRIDVARSITLGTNVPDSVTAAINREASNMVQGIVVLSDGRSNLGSESSYTDLRERANREKIPVFTVVVGEDRERVEISISDIQAPDSAPIDEEWKIVVDADGRNLANKDVEVELELFAPGNIPTPDKKIENLTPDEVFKQKLTFAPGDPPHGQTEFVIGPAKLKNPKLTTDSKDAAIQKRVLVEGKWAARARIARDPLELQDKDNPFHLSTVREITVIQQKLRILLMAGAPTREFTHLRTLLAREVLDKRATLTTFVQNDAGTSGKLTGEQDELVIPKFPTKFDLKTTGKISAEDKPYNLNEYDVLIAFDPDWSELSGQQAEDLSRWVREGGGGIIYVAGPINTFQLARVEENSRLDPLLKVLPVQPADIIAKLIKGIPTHARRLDLKPKAIIGSDLLKLDDKVPDDPIAGWERFFTDRDKYVMDPDRMVDLNPTRGFFSCYPLLQQNGLDAAKRGLQENGVKVGSAVLAEFVDVSDTGEAVRIPYLVTNNPSAAWRTCFLGSGEFHKMRSYEPAEGTGREYFERIWIKLIKYMAGKRNIKAPRGRLLVGKEAVSGGPLRVQARILNESASPYPVTTPPPKFTIIQEPAGAGEKRSFGPFDLAVKKTPDGRFDGYYAGEITLHPKTFAPGESTYRVEIDVPDSPSGEKLTGEFKIRTADPEMDNKRPDFAAMLRMASEFDKEFQARLPDKVRIELGTKLPKEAGVHRLAFKASDTELLRLIPECMKTDRRSAENRGPMHDLWDRGFNMPTWTPENPTTNKYLASWWSGQRLSVVLLAVVLLLSIEWLSRKLLRLA